MAYRKGKEKLICWSKVCLLKDDWTWIIASAFVVVLYMMPIIYYTFLR